MPERGPDLSPEPTYNSALASTSGVMGYGWSFPYSMSVHIVRGTATVIQEDGSQVVFKRGADKQFHAAPRVIASFQQNSGGTYTLTRGSSRSTCPSYLLQSCERFTFSNGQLARESTVDGSVTITRDSKGRPTSAKADSGDSLTFGYTSGRITSITGPGGVSEHFTYSASGNLIVATGVAYDVDLAYDPSHRLTSVRDALGRTTRYHYNSSGRVTAVTDPLGHQTTYHYDGVNHTTTITSPEGRRVVLSYEQGELVDVATGPSGVPPLAEWTFAYDPTTLAGTKTVDARLRVTTAASDADGVPLALTDALGKTTTFTYSDTGRRSSVTDPMGVKTRFTYDENGNVLTRTTPNTSFGTKQLQIYVWRYDDPVHPGDVTSSVDPLGNETDYTYDSRGNPHSVTDPLGNRMIIGHDSLGNPGPITDALGHTTDLTYDAVGNLLTTTDGTGATTTYTYDGDNELASSTDPAGRTTTYSYNADGQLSAIHRPDGTTSRATYGADGEIKTTVDPAGGKQSFTYDELGRRVGDTDQLGRTTTFAFDAVGNVTASTDAMGVTATNTYDGDNRLLSTSYSDGVTPTVSYAYDADGRRISMTDGTGTTTYHYDSLGRNTYIAAGGVIIVTDGYDLAGNRIALQYPNGHTVTMQYDGDGQMTGVTDWLGNTTQFHYDRASRLTGLKEYNPTLAYAAGKTTSWGLDAANQILHITHRDANGVPYATFDYTRAVDGRITSVHTTGLGQPDQTYSYDAKGRLGAENSNLLSFDSRNNVTRLPDGSTLSYDAGDELVSRQSGPIDIHYTLSDVGERTGATSPGETVSYAWNGAGDLTSFSDNGTTTSYTVNGDGQRVSSSGGGVAHSFVWDTARGVIVKQPGGGMPPAAARGSLRFALIHSRSDDASIQPGSPSAQGPLSDGSNSFIYGPDGLPIEQIDNAGHALFLDEDAQGSVRLLTDVAGDVKGTASYDAFGNQTAQSGESSPFGFDGMYLDSESGLYAMSGSVYDPATGQNLTRSTMRVCDGRNGCGWNSARGDGQTDKIAGPTPGAVVYRGVWMVRGGGSTVDNAFYTEWAAGPRHYDDLRVGDGFDENCNGDGLCVLSPYALRGGDPVNGWVAIPDRPRSR